MKKKELNLIKSLLGEDILEALQKSEITGGLVKLNTNTVTDPNEIKIALQIVPRSILTYLFMNLKDMAVGGTARLALPFAEGTFLNVNKLSPDNYSGELHQNGKRLAEFKYRSLPGVGLVLMSSLELYDIKQLNTIESSDYNCEKAQKLQNIIDERIQLYNIIQSVVDKKMMERDALKELIRQRLTRELFSPPVQPKEEAPASPIAQKKTKLGEFLEGVHREQGIFELDKSEIHCPDCNAPLYKGGDKISLCICYGEFFTKNISIMKKEGKTVKIKFPRQFGSDNIEMLMEALKGKK